MQRNEEFLRNMLHFVSLFYTRYVVAGISPPANMMADMTGYAAFLQLTLQVARNTPELMHIAKPAIARGSDMRTFLN